MPRVRLLSRTNLDQNYQHSVVISLLRGLAALEVVAAHLRGQLYPSLRSLEDPTLWYQALAFFTGFAHLAVVVFFVLSGWLVGGSLLNKLDQPRVMLWYAVDRLTRMWIVLIPAFVLTLAIGTLTDGVDSSRISYSPDNEYSVAAFVGNLFGLQGIAVPRFGGNYSLWSLANEMWYYALFPLLVLPFVGKSRAARYASAVAALVIASQLPFQIVLYFLVWLLGAVCSRVQIDAGRTTRWLLVGVLLGMAVCFRLFGSTDVLVPESFAQDLVFSVVLLLVLSSLQFPSQPRRRGTRVAAAVGACLSPFSFTLYVVHFPLLDLLRHLHAGAGGGALSPADPASLLVFAAMLVVILALAWLFHLPFEAQTYRLRRFIKEGVLRAEGRRASLAA
jgi:peptidoglycan/LPS O-acetylase OafA/YrhL